jgi:hypothetical protein
MKPENQKPTAERILDFSNAWSTDQVWPGLAKSRVLDFDFP